MHGMCRQRQDLDTANRWHRNQCGYRPFVLSISDVGTKAIDEKNHQTPNRNASINHYTG
jgi:hypothetical protein